MTDIEASENSYQKLLLETTQMWKHHGFQRNSVQERGSTDTTARLQEYVTDRTHKLLPGQSRGACKPEKESQFATPSGHLFLHSLAAPPP